SRAPRYRLIRAVDHDTVPAGGLRAVQRLVGGLEQGNELRSVSRRGGDSDRDSQPARLARPERDDRRLEPFADSFGDFARFPCAEPGQVDRELLAPVARGDVLLANARCEQARERSERLVAGGMAVTIV